MESYSSQSHKKNIIKEHVHDLSKILDSRITEIYQKLEKNKIELLENYEKFLNESDLFDTSYKNINLLEYNFDNLLDINTIQNLKDLKLKLDQSLSSYESLFKITDKFKGNLSKMIHIKENEIKFSPIVFANNQFSPCKWNQIQYKQNFKLENEAQTNIVNYIGCYETYTSETFYEEGVNKIILDVYCIRTTEWHSIGLVNENYNQGECTCMKKNCFFMMKRDGTNFIGGTIGNNTGFTFPDRSEPYRLEYEINLENENAKFWKLTVGENVYGPYKLIGRKFKIAVGNCNGGEVKYVLNPQYASII